MIASASWRAFSAQTRVELLLTARRYENLLVTLAIPIVLLVFLALVPIAGVPPGAAGVNVLVPRIVAVALIGTGLVSLGIATAYERGYGTLKRLLGSPLPRWALLASKAVATLATVVGQLAMIALVALVLGWSPPGGVVAAVARALPVVAAGTMTFAALGLLLAGTLRPEAVLAVANGLYLLLVLLGGVVVPPQQLPAPWSWIVPALPSAQLTRLLEGAMGPAALDPITLAGLLAWGAGFGLAALFTFRAD